MENTLAYKSQAYPKYEIKDTSIISEGIVRMLILFIDTNRNGFLIWNMDTKSFIAEPQEFLTKQERIIFFKKIL